MNQVVEQPQRSNAVRERIEVVDTVPILDTSRFEHMQRIATVMAHSTMMPESLYMTGKANEKMRLPHEQIMSNCFLVVNQALRWGLDPFAVAQCVSVVHGKLCYEGKLVSAVLQAKLDRNLHHHFTGSGDDMRVYLSDERFTDEIIKELKPGYRRQDMRIFDGSVNEWKTTGANSPWSPKNFTRMLIYRGTRDWCRIYEPALMLGIYTDDEMEDMSEHTRARELRDVTPAKPSLMKMLQEAQQETSQASTSEREGFDPSFVQSETDATLQGDVIDAETNSNTDDASTPASSVDADAAASASEAVDETPSPSTVSTDHHAWLLNIARLLWAATSPNGDIGVFNVQRKVANDTYPMAADCPEQIQEKAKSVRRYCLQVIANEIEQDDGLKVIAGVVGVDQDEILKQAEAL